MTEEIQSSERKKRAAFPDWMITMFQVVSSVLFALCCGLLVFVLRDHYALSQEVLDLRTRVERLERRLPGE